jgi:hypothetical protein
LSGNGSEPNPFPYHASGRRRNRELGPIWPTNIDLAAFDKNYGVPYTYNYNLNIQRALTSNLLLPRWVMWGRSATGWPPGTKAIP